MLQEMILLLVLSLSQNASQNYRTVLSLVSSMYREQKTDTEEGTPCTYEVGQE